MNCNCGGKLTVKLIDSENVAIQQCDTCGRGVFIPQSTEREVWDYRARVAALGA